MMNQVVAQNYNVCLVSRNDRLTGMTQNNVFYTTLPVRLMGSQQFDIWQIRRNLDFY